MRQVLFEIPGLHVKIFGYGLTKVPTKDAPPLGSPILQTGGVSLISRDACAGEYPGAIGPRIQLEFSHAARMEQDAGGAWST